MNNKDEYDAFGPWVYEIGDRHAIPSLFSRYYNETEKPLMMIKIPRSIERKDANPDMDLYDYLIEVFDKYIYIMERAGDSVKEKKINYKQVVAVRDYKALLYCRIYLYLNDGVFSFSYSAVSERVLTRMLNIIRSKCTIGGTGRPVLDSLPYDIYTIEFLYAGLINDIKRTDSTADLVAYQPNIQIKFPLQNFIGRIAALINIKWFLLCTAFVTGSKELIIIERETPLKERSKSDYTYSLLFIPYSNITGIKIFDYKPKQDLKKLQIDIQCHTFYVLFESGNKQIQKLPSTFKYAFN